MEPNISDLLEWRLQVRFFDSSESASFASRKEAIEYAQALIKDYARSIGITLVHPSGQTETIQESAFMAQDGTH